jgi:hypothetical protein
MSRIIVTTKHGKLTSNKGMMYTGKLRLGINPYNSVVFEVIQPKAIQNEKNNNY